MRGDCLDSRLAWEARPLDFIKFTKDRGAIRALEEACSLAVRIEVMRDAEVSTKTKIKRKEEQIREVSLLLGRIQLLSLDCESQKLVFLPSFWSSWRQLARRIWRSALLEDEDVAAPPPPPPPPCECDADAMAPPAEPPPEPPAPKPDLTAALAVRARLVETRDRLSRLNATLREEAVQLSAATVLSPAAL